MAITLLRPYQNLTTIAFIDGSLTDLQTILTDLDPSVTAIVLDPEQDGIQQMAESPITGEKLWHRSKAHLENLAGIAGKT